MSTFRIGLMTALLLGLNACGERENAAPLDAFAAFQTAALNGDREALAALLTDESRPAAYEINFEDMDGYDALTVIEVNRANSGRCELRVEEPEACCDEERSWFVLIREAGEWRVDLVETLLANHGVRPGEGFDLTPTRLDQEQIEGLGAVEASAIR